MDVEKELEREPEEDRTFSTAIKYAEMSDAIGRSIVSRGNNGSNRNDDGRKPMDINAMYGKGQGKGQGKVRGKAGSKPRSKLTPQERERRFENGLCLYCGGEGHQSTNCPEKGKNKKQ